MPRSIAIGPARLTMTASSTEHCIRSESTMVSLISIKKNVNTPATAVRSRIFITYNRWDLISAK